MIIFLYGPDTYRSKKKLNQLIEKFKRERDPSGLNITILEGSNISLELLHQALFTTGFLASKHLVIIRDLIKKYKKEDIFKELISKIEKIGKSEDIQVIFWEESINVSKLNDRKRKFFNLLKKGKYVEKFELLKPEQISIWIKQEIERQGGKIDYVAIRKLAAYVENNLWQLSNEINKLIAYKLDKPITSSDIDLLVEAKIDNNIFRLVDAVAEKNRRRALQLINEQLKKGVAWGYLLTMIIKQFRNLLLVRDKLDREGFVSSQSLAKELNIHPFVAQKSLVQARYYSLKKLKKIYEELLDIDAKLKSERVSPELLFDLFVTEVCG